jgi:hypothetical protein
MFQPEHVLGLLAELDQLRCHFEALDGQVSALQRAKSVELGLSDDMLQKAMADLKFGAAGDLPIPDQQALKALNAKRKVRQRLARVWAVRANDDASPIVFELDDGSLWQLSDVGLSWSPFKYIDSTWVEHPRVRQYLPAMIDLRPRRSAAFAFEFRLARGATLWVKPGLDGYAFRWGVRAPKRA